MSEVNSTTPYLTLALYRFVDMRLGSKLRGNVVPMLLRGFSKEQASYLHCRMSVYCVPVLHGNTMHTNAQVAPLGTGTSEAAWYGAGFVHCLIMIMIPVPCMRSHWTPSSTPSGGNSDIA